MVRLDISVQTVTFITQNNAPLPDPRYLALHAACAEVVRLFVAGQYIESIDGDIGATSIGERWII